MKLDGQPMSTPASFVGVVGILRSLEAVSPQTLNATSYEFVSWSDGGAAAHNISTPASNTTYTATYRALTGDGLSATYFNNRGLSGASVTRIDPVVDFNWGAGSPVSGIDPETFSVRWSGQVQPQFAESYTFRTRSDDGVRLWVNGVRIIDNWRENGLVENSGTISLNAGQKYTIRLEYFEGKGSAQIQLMWSSPTQPLQIIPMSRLFSTP